VITAIDTNVLVDLFGADPAFGPAAKVAVRACRNDGDVVACEVVWAEVAGVFPTPLEAQSASVSFEEAITALADEHAISAPDFACPDRWITIGFSALLRVLFGVHSETLSSGHTRIISARKASPVQRRKYHEEI
jgi:uncharacterized DUF497 family protein